jgi:hypothetical protein
MRRLGSLRAGAARLVLLAIVLVACSVAAQAQTRRAFIIGNKDYRDGNIQQLQRTINDARDVAKDLEEIGFD